MTIRQSLANIAQRLTPCVGASEAQAMASVIIQDIKGYTPVQVAIHGDRQLLPETLQRIDRIVDRVIAGAPLQYAIGSAYFHGRNFRVTPDTLIPRPETSQLVDIICDKFQGRKDLKILDIGTGSGSIAISLALDLPFSQVCAIDISEKAIEVARDNAKSLKARVDFAVADALHLSEIASGSNLGTDDQETLKQINDKHFDVIVSNPPYVMESERSSMDPRVTDYEPSQALFVPDSDPLLFYRAIANWARDHLAPGGILFFEINPLCSTQLKKLLSSLGFSVDILPDYKATPRFAQGGRAYPKEVERPARHLASSETLDLLTSSVPARHLTSSVPARHLTSSETLDLLGGGRHH